MSTTTVITTAPSPNPPGTKLQNILSIINLTLGALSAIPILAGPIALEQVFQKILTNALQAYNAEAGQPLDISKIPLEDLVK